MPRLLHVNVRKQLALVGLGLALTLCQRLQHRLALTRLQFRILLVIPRRVLLQISAHAVNRVVLTPPHLQLLGAAVARAVVRRGMVAKPVSHSLDHHRPVLSKCELLGRLGRLVHGKQVIAVTPDGSHAVSGSPRDEPVTRHLLLNGRGDSEAIVAEEEHDRAMKRGGKVECSVEIALAGCTVAAVAHCNGIGCSATLELQSVGGARGLRQLCGQRRRNRHVVQFLGAVVDRHLSALAQIRLVGETLVGELLQGEATPHQHAGLAVLRKNNVVVRQRARRAHVNGLFAGLLHVERDSALALRVVEHVIQHTEANHRLIQLHHVLRTEVLGHYCALTDAAVRVQHLVRLHDVTVLGQPHLERGREGHHVTARVLE
mmetsp:Transcript_11881/g.28339  ORF Transcript_11881/g.28339 Transcript_11881/m.28339 type:complete len:374 (-) Transcript_11881:199-1320(-)